MILIKYYQKIIVQRTKKVKYLCFFIHPTSLFSFKNWNADTSHFSNNKIIDLVLENQASVFAGITDLYVPHYRDAYLFIY